MTYKINGTELSIQPTSGRWLPRSRLGVDGNGHPVYAGTYEFQMEWNLLGPSEVNTLQTFFNSVLTTGSAVVDLPKFADGTYQFYSYSGCVLHEPEYGPYFAEHYTDVRLLVTNIIVS